MRNTALTEEIKSKILSWIRGVTLGILAYAAIMLLSTGKWDWLWGWVYFALLVSAMAAHVFVLVPINPALLADRAGGMRQPGAKRWDIQLATLASLAYFTILIVAALDERWVWTGEVSLSLHLFGALLFITGWVFFLWAMACNPFFSESVRIHADHRVATQGPYRIVRHPGYFGNVIGCLGQPLLLGSWWAYIPAILTIIAFAVRTALEDKTLREELNGYSDFSERVRYRLIPGLW
jgi:protein-S-isoprenylcysteine O-methyltransferase Ste14